ncbi:MAG TPA: hypothetical protein VNY05_27365 [Candidatus Acidoferrales bacterium]|nr:hypothetical protein [Candidatus Acidoferrales bacterium]
MKSIVIPVFLFCITFLSPRASAVTATFAGSNQTVSLTGLGGNVQGEGQSRITWGSCVYDGTNTKCTLSATYTGVGGGGTLTALLTYRGNGPSPLTGTSISPGSNEIIYSLSAGSLVVSLTENTGATVTFLSQAIFDHFIDATCTGVAACSVGQVGLTPNATITGFVNGTFDDTPVIRTSQGVISASAYGAFSALAPGTWMEIYGTNLANVVSQLWASTDFKGAWRPPLWEEPQSQSAASRHLLTSSVPHK